MIGVKIRGSRGAGAGPGRKKNKASKRGVEQRANLLVDNSTKRLELNKEVDRGRDARRSGEGVLLRRSEGLDSLSSGRNEARLSGHRAKKKNRTPVGPRNESRGGLKGEEKFSRRMNQRGEKEKKGEEEGRCGGGRSMLYTQWETAESPLGRKEERAWGKKSRSSGKRLLRESPQERIQERKIGKAVGPGGRTSCLVILGESGRKETRQSSGGGKRRR